MFRQALLVVVAIIASFAASAQDVTGSPAVTAQYRDQQTIERITLRLAGMGRETWDTVLAEGPPDLTWGSVASFAILMSEALDIQLTEAESELIAKKFVERHRTADAAGRKFLAEEWAAMLGEMSSSNAAKLRVRTRLGKLIQTAVDAKIGWGIAAREAIDRRFKSLQKASGRRPAWAPATYDEDMSVGDLDASMELLYFMWVASGRAPEYVTLENVALLREYFRTQFRALPSDMQYALANGQKIYAGLRMAWYTGDESTRSTLAQTFAAELDAMGLYDPDAGSSTSSGDAWSDVAGKSRSDFAAEMVVGLAGSSYKSAW